MDQANDYTYTSRNNVETITDPLNRTTRYAYDLLDRLTRIEQPDGSSIKFEYDEQGNLTVLTTPRNTDNYFTWNSVDKLESFTSPLDSVTTYQYDKENKLSRINLPSGKTISNTYVDSRLDHTVTDESYNVQTASNSILGINLTRNDSGRITGKTEILSDTNTFTYGYDQTGQLLTVTKDGVLVEEYRYDDNGNRTWEMNALRGISSRVFTVSDDDHTITAGAITYEFDADDKNDHKKGGAD